MIIKRTGKRTLVFRLVVSVVLLAVIGGYGYASYLYVGNQNRANDAKQAAILEETTKLSIASAKTALKKQPVYITLPGAQPIRAIVDDYSLTGSIWALVSRTSPISTDYIPEDLIIPNVSTRTDKSSAERSVRADIETPLINMFAAANDAGYSLMIGSGYRSAAQQQIYLDSAAASVGLEVANQTIAIPGQSEHQTGLAVDISTTARNCYLDTCFADTSDGQWLVQNSYKYGFILRYQKGKESISGYNYEPWHFRYVGVDLATALHDSNLTLDEAWSYLKDADDTLRANGAI